MIKIAHISDIHIHNLKEHDLYKSTFKQLYKNLKEEKPDLIVNTGDTYHSKVSISPEAYKLAGQLFINLLDIAPLIVILGNHDFLQTNSQRLDSISPLSELIKNKNFHFLKSSGKFSFKDVDFYLHSLLDDGINTSFDVDSSKISIGLYHGIVSGAQTPEKFQLVGAPVDIFDKYDYTMLGDIHTTNLKLNSSGKIRYPGSLIQQNFGETISKGYLLWNIVDKNEYSCEFKQLDNNQPFITISVDKDIRNYNFDEVPKSAKIRIINNSSLDNVKFRKLAIGIKNKYKFKNITILEQPRVSDLRKIDENLSIDNLHDVNVHEKLLKDFFKDEKKEDIDKIIELNKIYFGKLKNIEQSKINHWNILNFSWENLFNYGSNNKIDFKNLKGVVGIFGKNRCGKSSVVDGILFNVFNKISKNLRGNQEIINNSKNNAKCEIEIQVNNDIYKLIRKIERTKSNKSSTSLELMINNKIQNDSSRIETDKVIQKQFGTLEDFLLTSVSPQFGSNTFIDEGSTKRKEILANFLELEIFDNLYEEAKDDFSVIKSTIKKLESKNFGDLIKETKANIDKSKLEKEDLEKDIQDLTSDLEKLKEESFRLSNILKNILKYDNDFLKKTENDIDSLKRSISSNEEQIEDKKLLYKKIKAQIQTLNDELSLIDLRKSQEVLSDGKNSLELLTKINSSIEILLIKKQELEKNAKLLDDVPCKGTYNCKFLLNAKKSVDELVIINQQLEDGYKNKEEIKKHLEELELTYHRNAISKHQDATRSLRELETQLDSCSHSVEKLFLLNKDKKNKLDKALEALEEFKNNENNIEKSKELLKINENKQQIEKNLEICKFKMQKLVEILAKGSNNLERLEEERENYETMIKNYTIFEKYIKAVNSNGMPFRIIKNKLGIINEKLRTYLTDVEDFEITFEDNDNNLNINLTDKNGTRAINMASGSEKMLASMAIRLSLLSISNLPRSNIFVLDEPGTALDSDNMENFTKMLDMIKQDFQIVFLISHIETLKDCCDKIIDISNNNGEANIVV